MKKIRKDDGSEVANPTAVDNKTAAFANVYDAKEQTVDLGAGKEFTDSTGTKTLKDGDYKFRLTPVTEGAPLPDGASGHVDASNIGNGRENSETSPLRQSMQRVQRRINRSLTSTR